MELIDSKMKLADQRLGINEVVGAADVSQVWIKELSALPRNCSSPVLPYSP